MLTLAMLAVLAAPVSVDVLGFWVEVKGDAVEVTRVQPDSPAAKAGLVPGVQLGRPTMPVYFFARGPLAQLNEVDLRDALTPTWGEALMVKGTLSGKTRTYVMARTDPEPKDRYGPLPLPIEKFKRLSTMDQARYTMVLSTSLNQGARTTVPALQLVTPPVADLNPAGVEANDRVAPTPEWLYSVDRLHFRCERSPMRRIELVGPSPVTKTVATSTDSALQGASVPVELPLWRVKDAQAACQQGLTTLNSVVLVGTLGCEGVPDVSVELSLPLTLHCDATVPRERYHLDALRVRSVETIQVGSREPTKLELWWRALKPTPVLVTVVELDARGAVAKRLSPAPPPRREEGDSTTLFVQLDTTKERDVQLALEVKFPDGTVDLSTPHAVRVITAERDETDRRAFAAKLAAQDQVMKRLRATFPNVCEKPDAAVKWLCEQPGVDVATNHDGHNLSFSMGGLPMIIDCHLR